MTVFVKWVHGLALASIVVMLGGCSSMVGSSGFTSDDEDEGSADSALVRSVMGGIGAVDPQRKPIKYQPRSPLAVPADTQDLPPPESDQTLEEVTGNQWPSEPEERRRAIRRAGQAREDARLGRLQNGDPRMSIGELQEGAVDQDVVPKRTDTSLSYRERKRAIQDKGQALTVYEMRNQSAQTKKVDIPRDATGAPKRQYLTQPPSSYRVPSPNAPVTKPEDKKKSFTRRWWDKLTE